MTRASWWLSGRDGTSTQERHGDTIRRPLQEMDGGKQGLGQSQEQMIVGWSQDEERVIDAFKDYLETCAHVTVKIDSVECLLRPENLEVSLRYVLKHVTFGAATSSSSSTYRKAEPLRGKQKMVGKSGKRR